MSDRRKGSGGRRGADDVGGIEVEGRRAVLELLRAGKREVRIVMLSEAVARDEIVDAIVEAAGPKLKIVTAHALREVAHTDSPPGVGARAASLRSTGLD